MSLQLELLHVPINRLACCPIRGVARDFIMLKSTKKKNEELGEIYVSASEKRVLTRLHGCAGWSAPFVRKQQNQGFSPGNYACIYRLLIFKNKLS